MPSNVNRSVSRKARPPGEEACRNALRRGPNMLVPWYLMGAYAYQCLDETLISDHLYDDISRGLAREWDSIVHEHKHIIDRAALASGTSSYLASPGDYPARVRGAVERILYPGRNNLRKEGKL